MRDTNGYPDRLGTCASGVAGCSLGYKCAGHQGPPAGFPRRGVTTALRSLHRTRRRAALARQARTFGFVGLSLAVLCALCLWSFNAIARTQGWAEWSVSDAAWVVALASTLSLVLLCVTRTRT